MTPTRRLVTAEAQVVYLCQLFEPTYMPEYLKWTAVWHQDPQNGRGQLPPPIGTSLERGAGIFWEVLDAQSGQVQAFQTPAVRLHLQTLLEQDA